MILLETYNNESLEEFINDNRDAMCEMPLKERLAYIDDLINRYVDAAGDRPAPASLNALASILDHEYVSDMSPTKIRDYEYPTLTESQIKRRMAREYFLDLENHSGYEVVGYRKETINPDDADGQTTPRNRFAMYRHER